MASAVGWLAACLSFWMVEKRLQLRLVAAMGVLVSLLLVLMKLLPVVPGHFSDAEWFASCRLVASLALLMHRHSLNGSV